MKNSGFGKEVPINQVGLLVIKSGKNTSRTVTTNATV
jgi:hypothetical protein